MSETPEKASTENESFHPLRALDSIGGILGTTESVVPGIVFTIMVAFSASITTAGIIAAGVALFFCIARLVRGQSVQYALSGLIGVVVFAFFASRTGKAESFFLPGLIFSVGYGTLWLVSIIIKYPLLGVIYGVLVKDGKDWRSDPELFRAFNRASWVWTAMFYLRAGVGLPLYFAGAFGSLAIIKVALGIPLFLLVLWVSWLIVKPLIGNEAANTLITRKAHDDKA